MADVNYRELSDEDFDRIALAQREFVKTYFRAHPLNETFIKSYDHLVNVGLLEIAHRSTTSYETPTTIGKISFDDIFVLPPFKGEGKLENIAQAAGQSLDKVKNSIKHHMNPGFRSEGTPDIRNIFQHVRNNWLLPRDCIRDNMTYALSVYGTIRVLEYEKPNIGSRAHGEEPAMLLNNAVEDNPLDDVVIPMFYNVENMPTPVVDKKFYNVKLFEFPLMRGSKWDWIILSATPKERFAEFGECDLDPMTDFIIKGKRKVFITQEKLSANVPRVIMWKKDTSEKIMICELRSESIEKRSITLRLIFFRTSSKDPYICGISMPFLATASNLSRSVEKEKVTRTTKDKTEFNVLNIFRFYAIWAMLKGRKRADLAGQLEGMTSIDIMMAEFSRYLDSTLTSPTSEVKRTIIDALLDTIIAAKKGNKIVPGIDSVIRDKEFIDSFAKKINLSSSLSYEHKIQTIKMEFDMQLFPHIRVTAESDYIIGVPFPKFITLTDMIVRYTKTFLGLKEMTDRDSYSTKQLATVGLELGTIIEKAMKVAIGLVVRTLKKQGYTENINVPVEMTDKGSREITTPIQTSFSSGNWRLKKGKPRTGVVQQHDLASLLAMWAMARKISIPSSSKSKIAKPRMVQGTGSFIVDPTNTPENEKAGLIKELSMSVIISNNNISAETWAVTIVSEFYRTGHVFGEKSGAADIPLFINNTFQGYVTPDVFHKLREEKRHGRLGISEVFRSIESDSLEGITSEYHVLTTGGRAMRPVFSVGPGNRFLALDGKFFDDPQQWTFEELIRRGVVEYVSANEVEFGEIAMDFKQFVQEGWIDTDVRQFNYIEIDPVFMLAIEAGTQPRPETNPVPRVQYYGHMGRQAISLPMSTFLATNDTDLKILHYSHKPLISTDVTEVIGLDQQGAGLNVTVWFMPSEATDEDPTKWNRDFIERGGFNATLFETYTVKANTFLSTTDDDLTRFSNGVVTVRTRKPEEIPEEETISNLRAEGLNVMPNVQEAEEEDEDVENEASDDELDGEAATVTVTEERPHGYKLPKIIGRTNVEVRPKEVLMRYKNGNDIDENKHVIKGSMTGWVHSTHRIKQGSETLQKVVVRFPHFPGQGDKLANRYAQKGVIGKVVDNRDMPYLERDGSTPDVIFSVTSFASRMTAGMLDEMLRGKAASTCNLNHIVKRLVTIEGGIITRKKDFYIRLTRILIPNVPGLPIVRYDDLEKLSMKEGRSVEVLINERYPNYQGGYGLMFKGETIIRDEKVVGHKVTYSVPQRDFVAKLKYGGYGILFSQLDKKRQEQYFYEHQDEIVPTYLIKDVKDYTSFEKLLKDATAFRPLKEEEISEYLLYKGYEPKGMEQAIDGITGRRFKALIFTGPCFYMHLKHLVEKKQQVRDQGSNSLTTRAPVKGRSSGGAVKKEEMTRVVLLAHGATKFLRQSFLTAADKFDHIVCRKCGKFCFVDYNASKAICENCPEPDPHKVTLPWATIKLAMIMSASGGDVTFNIKGERSIQNQNVVLDDPVIAGNRPRQSIGNKSVNVYRLQEPEGGQGEVCIPDEEFDEINQNIEVADEEEEEATSEEEMEAEEDRLAGIIHM